MSVLGYCARGRAMKCEARLFWRGDRLFEFDFRPEALEITVHESHCQSLAIAATGDCAVLGLGIELSADLCPVPALGMADISEPEVILLGPEEGRCGKWLAPARHVA